MDTHKISPLIKKYQEIYNYYKINPNQSRFILFEPRDQSGWGNRLRGLTLCILFAIATRRVLVIHDFLLEEHFLAPEGCSWKYRDWKKLLTSFSIQPNIMNLHLSPYDWNQEEWLSYANESMDALFPGKVVVLRQSIGFFDQLIINPHYKALWLSLGLNPESKTQWLGSLINDFLNRPTPKLKYKYDRFLRRISIDLQKPFALVQFRTFYDVGSPQKKLVKSFIKEIQRELLKIAYPDMQIYIATDDALVTKEIAQHLSKNGNIIVSPTKVVHTGSLHNGWELVLERVLNKIFGKKFAFLDFWGWLPEYKRPRPHTAILAEWMFYGNASIVFSSFTSYIVYAMARTGNIAIMYRFDPETELVELLSNEKYFF